MISFIKKLFNKKNKLTCAVCGEEIHNNFRVMNLFFMDLLAFAVEMVI